MVTDPVCSMNIDEHAAQHTLTYDSEPYFFCSAGCRAEFERHPEDYVKPSGKDISTERKNV